MADTHKKVTVFLCEESEARFGALDQARILSVLPPDYCDDMDGALLRLAPRRGHCEHSTAIHSGGAIGLPRFARDDTEVQMPPFAPSVTVQATPLMKQR